MLIYLKFQFSEEGGGGGFIAETLPGIANAQPDKIQKQAGAGSI